MCRQSTRWCCELCRGRAPPASVRNVEIAQLCTASQDELSLSQQHRARELDNSAAARLEGRRRRGGEEGDGGVAGGAHAGDAERAISDSRSTFEEQQLARSWGGDRCSTRSCSEHSQRLQQPRARGGSAGEEERDMV